MGAASGAPGPSEDREHRARSLLAPHRRQRPGRVGRREPQFFSTQPGPCRTRRSSPSRSIRPCPRRPAPAAGRRRCLERGSRVASGTQRNCVACPPVRDWGRKRQRLRGRAVGLLSPSPVDAPQHSRSRGEPIETTDRSTGFHARSSRKRFPQSVATAATEPSTARPVTGAAAARVRAELCAAPKDVPGRPRTGPPRQASARGVPRAPGPGRNAADFESACGGSTPPGAT
jgi:hypothetical protein